MEINKVSLNKAALVMTELTREKGFVVFGESFWYIVLPIKQHSPLPRDKILMKYLYIIDMAPPALHAHFTTSISGALDLCL